MIGVVKYQLSSSRLDLVSPLRALLNWAVKHHAADAFLRLLDETKFLDWINPSWSIEVEFCGPDDIRHYPSAEGTDLSWGQLEPGDVVFVASGIDKEGDYRRDDVTFYKWVATRKEWALHKQGTFYYARRFPFGGYSKRMPSEWGSAREPLIYF